jgi:peptidylprolyl isomerase
VRRIAVLLLLPFLLLTACGGGGDSSSGRLPEVTGEFGSKPAIAEPSGDPSATLVDEVLTEGTGPTVAKGDILVVHYLGETWANAKVFDNSYDRKQPAAFPIGIGRVVPGWDKGLVGKTVGSRVVLVLPPAEGYGEQGNPSAGITKDDTLLFVVDIVDTITKAEQTAHGTAVAATPATLPKVSNDPAKKPVVTVAKGAKAPTQPQSAVIIAGDGAPIDPAKSVLAQIVQVEHATGKPVFDSWTEGTPQSGPQQIPVSAIPGLEAAVKGQKVGSRVLLVLPASGQAPAASVLVLDIVANV